MQTANTFQRLFGFALGKPEPGSANWYFRRDKLAVVCVWIIVIMVLIAIFAPWLTPYPEQGLGDPNLPEKFMAPSACSLIHI